MRLFGNYLASRGSSLCTYFRLMRPRGVTLDFREILKRVNTPFMFCLKIPGNTSLAEVCLRKHNFFVILYSCIRVYNDCPCSGPLIYNIESYNIDCHRI